MHTHRPKPRPTLVVVEPMEVAADEEANGRVVHVYRFRRIDLPSKDLRCSVISTE